MRHIGLGPQMPAGANANGEFEPLDAFEISAAAVFRSTTATMTFDQAQEVPFSDSEFSASIIDANDREVNRVTAHRIGPSSPDHKTSYWASVISKRGFLVFTTNRTETDDSTVHVAIGGSDLQLGYTPLNIAEQIFQAERAELFDAVEKMDPTIIQALRDQIGYKYSTYPSKTVVELVDEKTRHYLQNAIENGTPPWELLTSMFGIEAAWVVKENLANGLNPKLYQKESSRLISVWFNLFLELLEREYSDTYNGDQYDRAIRLMLADFINDAQRQHVKANRMEGIEPKYLTI